MYASAPLICLNAIRRKTAKRESDHRVRFTALLDAAACVDVYLQPEVHRARVVGDGELHEARLAGGAFGIERQGHAVGQEPEEMAAAARETVYPGDEVLVVRCVVDRRLQRQRVGQHVDVAPVRGFAITAGHRSSLRETTTPARASVAAANPVTAMTCGSTSTSPAPSLTSLT